MNDVDYLGLTLWAEARSQPYEGLLAVANVIRNRLRSKKWGTTYKDVVLAKQQFSCWNPGRDKNHQLLLAQASKLEKDLPLDNADLMECLYLAQGVISGMLYRDSVKGAMWYMTNAQYALNPKWAKDITPSAIIGDHCFFTHTN